ncbi:unnamed protein product [Heterobilharzia americana]|nr:unnamed protein product [Heterobilharzia americana]
MGNTPTHHKRRFSGDAEGRQTINTPPNVNVNIPPSKRRNMHSLTNLSQSAPADCLDEMMSSTTDDMKVYDKSTISVDEATSMLRAASLREPINLDDNNDNSKFRHLLQPERMSTSKTVDDIDEEDNSLVYHFERSSGAGLSCSADERIMYGVNHPQTVETRSSIDRAKTLPPQKLSDLKLPTVFRWNGGGKEIYISGTFNKWKKRIPMVRRNSGAYVIIDCQPGTHEYKYFIDGAWYHDPTKPTVDNEYGTKNNVVCVNQSDFDVLHALERDQASSRKHSDSSDSIEVDRLGHSPPGEYGRFMPANLTELQQRSKSWYSNSTTLAPTTFVTGILNVDTNAHCDPSLLPQPNHVIVNHLYALSIKDGVVVLSVITRFRQKFVSTLFYKPIEK